MTSGILSLGIKEFEQIRKLIYEKVGIRLGKNKISMVQARLNKRLKKLNIATYKEYVRYLGNKGVASELPYFINALTTNKTEFFREPDHFDFLKSVYLRGLTSASCNNKSIYIWSAACSRGEEVYTLGMVFDQFIKYHASFDYRILGTDIDTGVLNIAEEGVYPMDLLRIIPPYYIKNYFLKGKDKNKQKYKINNILKEKIKFRRHNLVDSNLILPIRFDIIFLRNVLIYFEDATIEKVIKKMYRHLKVGGLLFLGHSEPLTGITHNFSHIGSSIYKREK